MSELNVTSESMEASEESRATTSNVTDQSSTAKRGHNIVDPNDPSVVIPSSKKPKIDLNEEKKHNVLKFLATSYARIHGMAFTNLDEGFRNINLGIQLTNIIFTAHNMLRQVANKTGGTLNTKAEKSDYKVTFMGTEHTLERTEVNEIVRQAAKDQGLEYAYFKGGDNDWYGTAAPYLNFFAAFGLRLQELRLGHNSMPINKTSEGSTSFNVSSYGLYGSHHVLLEGCTYPPERRSSMAQSLGPCTALLCLIRSAPTYVKKWEDAVKRALAHVPCIDEIIQAVKGKTANEVKPLMTIIADIILIATSRQATRMCFPLNMFTRIVMDQTFAGKKYQTYEAANGAMYGPLMVTLFDTAGKGGFLFYKSMCELKWTLCGDFVDSHVPEIIYHCIFGTYKEDLSILAKITNRATWHTREAMGNTFQKMNHSQVKHNVTLIRNTYYSKLSSANQTGLLSSAYIQTTAIPVFSGHRTQTFSEEFFEQLNRRIGTKAHGKTIQELISTMSEVLVELQKHLRSSNNKLDMGTTQWRKVDSLSRKGPGEIVPNLRIAGDGLFFLGKRQ